VENLLPSFDESLAQARGGCSGTTGRLFDQFRGYLLTIANRRLDARLQAKLGGSDLVQQTLAHAHRDFANFRGSTEGEFLAWLRQILANQVAQANRDYLGTAKRDVSRERALGQDDASRGGASWLPADTDTPSKQAMARETDVRLLQALARLRTPYQQVIELRNRRRQTFAAIGAEMSISEERARRLWTRAIERLRREIVALNQ
jgi:RNA polymerase sigma-70 factor (ECF subfamily)